MIPVSQAQEKILATDLKRKTISCKITETKNRVLAEKILAGTRFSTLSSL